MIRPRVAVILLLAGAAALIGNYSGLFRDGGPDDIGSKLTVPPEASLAVLQEPVQDPATQTPQTLPRKHGGAPAEQAFDQAQRDYRNSSLNKFMAFRKRLQDFFDEVRVRPVQDHEPAARALLAELERFSADGYLNQREELVLRLSLLRHTMSMEEYSLISENLISQVRAEAAEVKRLSRPDPRWVRYRSEERRIVEEVAAMTSDTSVSTQEYLRQRLQALRVETYAN